MARYGCRSPRDPRVVTTIRRAGAAALGSPVNGIAPLRNTRSRTTRSPAAAAGETLKHEKPTCRRGQVQRAGSALQLSQLEGRGCGLRLFAVHAPLEPKVHWPATASTHL